MSPHGLAQRNVQGPPQSNLGAERPGTLSGSLQLSIPLWGHSFPIIHWRGRGTRTLWFRSITCPQLVNSMPLERFPVRVSVFPSVNWEDS